MNEQVLSIEQMQELEEIGIDTSKASMHWSYLTFYDPHFKPFWSLQIGSVKKDKENIPTFTLQDILERLPVEIDRLLWRLGHGCVYYQDIHTGYINENLVSYGDTMICAAFNMLKKCKQNNYI